MNISTGDLTKEVRVMTTIDIEHEILLRVVHETFLAGDGQRAQVGRVFEVGAALPEDLAVAGRIGASDEVGIS